MGDPEREPEDARVSAARSGGRPVRGRSLGGRCRRESLHGGKRSRPRRGRVRSAAGGHRRRNRDEAGPGTAPRRRAGQCGIQVDLGGWGCRQGLPRSRRRREPTVREPAAATDRDGAAGRHRAVRTGHAGAHSPRHVAKSVRPPPRAFDRAEISGTSDPRDRPGRRRGIRQQDPGLSLGGDRVPPPDATRPPVDAYRGAGRPEALFLLERMVDILARKLKKDPADIRRKNFIPADKFPYATAMGLTYDSGNYPGTLEKALDKVGYEKLRKEQAEGRRKGKLMGIGLSTYVEICGLGPSAVVTSTGFAGGLWGASTVRLHPTGKATAYTGGHPHGQGEETTFAQIVAEELGIPMADVEVVHGDTKLTPYGQGTYGSRTTPVEGGSIALSARKVRDKARKIAAHLLEAREEDIEFADGKFVVKGSPKAAKTIQEIAWAAYMAGNMPKGVEPVLDATTFYDPTNFVFPFGCHICVVDVDRETGQVKIRRYVAVDDVGNQINPMIVEGQVHGGVLQGLAQAMLEQSVYDENGNLLTNSLIEYLVPTALEAPRIETDSTVTPSPHNPLGVKGVGETGTIASSQAYVNAVCDAVGVDHIDMPVTAEKVWRVLHPK